MGGKENGLILDYEVTWGMVTVYRHSCHAFASGWPTEFWQQHLMGRNFFLTTEFETFNFWRGLQLGQLRNQSAELTSPAKYVLPVF
jgi:hypothetical protein